MRRVIFTLTACAMFALAGCNVTPPTPPSLEKPAAKPAATGPANTAAPAKPTAPTAPQGALPPPATQAAVAPGVTLSRTAPTAPPAVGAAPTPSASQSPSAVQVITRPIGAGQPVVAPQVAANAQPPVLTGVLTGSVTYRERIALPPDNIVTVRLLDVSRQDAPSITLAEHVITNAKSVPVAFELKYDPKSVDPKNTYSVSANIRDSAGKLLWVTDTRYPALTNGAPVTNINLILRSATATSQTTTQNALTGMLTGTVTYLERMALPPNSVVTVQLQDVSLADAPAKVLSQQVITTAKNVPVPFGLAYDPAAIEARNRYIVRAEIRSDGQLMWTTDKAYPVLTAGAPTSGVEIVLTRVATAAQPAATPPVVSGRTEVTTTAAVSPTAAQPGNVSAPLTSDVVGQIVGSLTYRERMALPPGASFVVSLIDVTNPVTPQLISEQTFVSASPSVSVQFILPYPVAAIVPNGLYELRAAISAAGKPIFQTPTDRLALVDANELSKGNVSAGEIVLVPANALAEPDIAETERLTGTVTYRERIALPQGAVLTVSLHEINSRGVPGRLITRTTSFADSQVPLPFELTYDPSQISENRRYGLIARITAGSSVWTNTRGVRVLTFNAPETDVEVLTRKIR